MPQINAVGGGRGIHPLRHHADNLDPFDDIAPSTVAMIIFFGSIIFATVGMATRDWLVGDKRAISAALKAHSTISSSTNYSSKKDYADADGESRSRSDIKPQIIQQWEPTFVSTVVLFSQIGFLGIILFVIYSLDKSSSDKPISMAGFDEDEFVFWILVILLYTYFVSWKRNDGKPEHRRNRTLDGAHVQDDATQTSHTTTSRSKMKEKIRQRTIEMASLRQRVEDGNRGDGASSQGSDLSKRLEEVLLTDDTVFDTILDTIDDDIQSKDESELGLLEKGSKFLGFNVYGQFRRICDVKQENDVLNRSQTLEWKGLLSVIMLVYQYNMGEYYQPFSNEYESSLKRVHVYDNLAKAAMTSLLFLTGYNHTYYFNHPSNTNRVFKLSRVLQVCMRINLLAVFMCLVLGKTNYGVCLIHTSWFLFIWAMMHIGHSMNYDKYLFRLKLLGAAVCIFLFWDCNISRVVKINGAWEASQTSWEWYCASYLHHWSAFIGAIFAINQPIASLQLRKLESLNLLSNTFAKTLLSGTLLVLALTWAAGPLRKTATVYNVCHPYFGIIPTLLLVNLRNVSCSLREHHIEMLSWLGKYSLEIFILHHHASNIVLISGYPRCNFLAISMILIFTARLLHNTTSVIRHMLLPANEEEKCCKNTVVCSGGIMILYAAACILTWTETVSLGTISTITMIVGILLYQVLTEMTWSDYRGTAPKLKKNQFEDDEEAEEGSTTKVSPPLLATLSIYLLGYALYQAVSTSSMHSCNPNHANKGRWVPLSACLARTKLDRNFNKMNYFGPTQSTLNTTEQWAWPENTCGFHYHSKTELQLKLQEKRIVLIGDSSVRNLYHSLCRFAGDLTAGGYEGTSTSHSDASALFGSTSLEFKWAPLSVDIITKIKGMTVSLPTASEGGPDVIIAGGGVWDKLHLENTDEVRSSQEVTIKTLASELKSLRKKFGVSVVWFVPPIINTVALNSDEKRAQISEGNVDEMRRMYAELGVLQSASFVLDGPKFTQDRVLDSFDGVHYPKHVYDAGSQIVLNALGHLWGVDANKSFIARSYLPATRSLINPYLGMMMLCFVLIGLFYFDGYFGVGYLAQFFVKKVSLSPSELYKDAFDHHPAIAQDQISKEEYTEVQEHESIGLTGRSSSSLRRR
eukprot:scaffold31375_cov166-Skeletonema_menzelii.AAC.1